MSRLLILAILFSTQLSAINHEPLFVKGHAEYIGKSRFKKKGFRSDHISFAEAHTELASFICYDTCHEEGLLLGIGYTRTRLDFEDNPEFDKKDYNVFDIKLIGLSHRLWDWEWTGMVTFHVNTDHFDFDHYTFWDLMMWGRYTYCENVGLHLGFYAYTGMLIDKILPIIGFDWQYSERLEISAVFPIDIFLKYHLCGNWHTGVAVHFFESRNRADYHEENSRALWKYENWGIEGFIDYACNEYQYINLHAGYTVGGKLKIANRHWKDSTHYKFKPSWFVGAEAGYVF